MVTGLYYAKLFGRFNAEFQKKRPHLAKKKVLFHQDNALAHTSAMVTTKLVELHNILLPHPPYSPDLAPYDLFFVSKPEKVTHQVEI